MSWSKAPMQRSCLLVLSDQTRGTRYERFGERAGGQNRITGWLSSERRRKAQDRYLAGREPSASDVVNLFLSPAAHSQAR